MQIANPIYDVVFKYLLEDDRVARLLIGKITGLDVESLALQPQEVTLRRGGGPSGAPLTLLRMDFAARVRTAQGGLRQVLIEIQKAPAPTVVQRFRRYLGQQLVRFNGAMEDFPDDGGAENSAAAVPVITIYFLGYDLGLSDEVVVDVRPQVIERRTGRVIDGRHSFVEGLHHRSHIVQIPRLTGRRRDDLERFLAVFDQALAVRNGVGRHLLSIDESDYPAAYEPVLRQLRKAAAEDGVRRGMEAEDELLRDSILLSQRAERAERQAEQERKEKERERHRAEQAEDALRQAKRESAQRLARSIRRLRDVAGMDADAIAQASAVDVEEVR